MLRPPRLLPGVIVGIAFLFATKLGLIWHVAGVALAAPTTPPAATTTDANPASPPKPEDHPAAAAAPKPPEHYSAAEVELLQELSKRRAEIEQRADALDHREVLLEAAEQRVDEKIAKLQQMQNAVDGALAKIQQQDDQRIASLVHIYENMKPQDAARIFEGMEIPSLLQLLGRMKDLKTAPILAAMAPEKARAVTIAMAQRQDVPEISSN